LSGFRLDDLCGVCLGDFDLPNRHITRTPWLLFGLDIGLDGTISGCDFGA
jgi:hypothetical protein